MQQVLAKQHKMQQLETSPSGRGAAAAAGADGLQPHPVDIPRPLLELLRRSTGEVRGKKTNMQQAAVLLMAGVLGACNSCNGVMRVPPCVVCKVSCCFGWSAGDHHMLTAVWLQLLCWHVPCVPAVLKRSSTCRVEQQQSCVSVAAGRGERNFADQPRQPEAAAAAHGVSSSSINSNTACRRCHSFIAHNQPHRASSQQQPRWWWHPAVTCCCRDLSSHGSCAQQLAAQLAGAGTPAKAGPSCCSRSQHTLSSSTSTCGLAGSERHPSACGAVAGAPCVAQGQQAAV